MKQLQVDFSRGFHPALDRRTVQAAAMTIAPGHREGGPSNRHRDADQWLYVVDGEGEAVVEGAPVALRPGVLLLIERGERHQIRNRGNGDLRTLNFYHPPAFNDQHGRTALGDG